MVGQIKDKNPNLGLAGLIFIIDTHVGLYHVCILSAQLQTGKAISYHEISSLSIIPNCGVHSLQVVVAYHWQHVTVFCTFLRQISMEIR